MSGTRLEGQRARDRMPKRPPTAVNRTRGDLKKSKFKFMGFSYEWSGPTLLSTAIQPEKWSPGAGRDHERRHNEIVGGPSWYQNRAAAGFDPADLLLQSGGCHCPVIQAEETEGPHPQGLIRLCLKRIWWSGAGSVQEGVT
jgi:hypothetical protein